jgi:cbb3-type cytochrome oxidase maturation protein
MIPLGLALSALAIWLFVWALKGGQFEDLDSPGWSIIMDEEQILEENKHENKCSEVDSQDVQVPGIGKGDSL